MKRRALFGVPFVAQFAVLDAVMRAKSAWNLRAGIGIALSLLLWALLATLATTRARKGILAAIAAVLFVGQVFVHRYYRVPLDVQVAASALHAWKDVQPVLVRSLPAFLGAVALVSVAWYALLSLARFPPPKRGAVAAFAALLALVLAALGPSLRSATPELRAIHALSALRGGPVEARVSPVSLPPLHSEKEELPAVLLILTESVRADDYGLATAPETAAATAGRVDFSEMRAVSSYTAVSLSALLTGRSQEGGRDAILAAPNLFDFTHAARGAGGGRGFVAYYSAQSDEVFETKNVRAALDRYVTVETLLGRPMEDDEDIVRTSLDALVVERFTADLPAIPTNAVVMLHLIGTHAPYHFTAADARFEPWDRVVAWSRLASLRNAYRNSIVAQDHSVARAVKAFVEHSQSQGPRPYLIVFTSDHGEAFGEHGAIHHGQNLYDEQVHVPGWASGPLVNGAMRAHAGRYVTHLDILPTMLDALGLWDNFAVRDARAKSGGRSLLRAWEERGPLPVTNCTGMFPCPVNAWGLFERDRKLVAQSWDGGWGCFALERGVGEVNAADADPGCARLREASRATFPRLPNGQPNR